MNNLMPNYCTLFQEDMRLPATLLSTCLITYINSIANPFVKKHPALYLKRIGSTGRSHYGRFCRTFFIYTALLQGGFEEQTCVRKNPLLSLNLSK